jgi:hypothetical protein
MGKLCDQASILGALKDPNLPLWANHSCKPERITTDFGWFHNLSDGFANGGYQKITM